MYVQLFWTNVSNYELREITQKSGFISGWTKLKGLIIPYHIVGPTLGHCRKKINYHNSCKKKKY